MNRMSYERRAEQTHTYEARRLFLLHSDQLMSEWTFERDIIEKTEPNFPKVQNRWTGASGYQLQQRIFWLYMKEKRPDVSVLKYWNRGPGRCGSASLGLSRFDYKSPSAAWSCFEVSSAGSCTRWPPQVPSNLNYSIILRKWGLCFMNRHRMVQQTNTTKDWKVWGFIF